MPNNFARCVNTDYCSLGDRRLVMRLDESEPLFCPECALALVPAPPWGQRRIPWPVLGALAMGAAAMASGYGVALRWPHAMPYLASAPIKSPEPRLDRTAIVSTLTTDGGIEPSAAKLFLATAMDDYLPAAAGEFVLRRRRGRPPRLDQAATAAIASLEAGVPPVAWPEDDEPGASMPWRQAMIMAALVSPGQPLDALPPPASGQPTEIIAPPMPVMSRTPASTPDNVALPHARGSGAIQHGVQPRAALQTPVPLATAQVFAIGHASLLAQDRVAIGGLAKIVLAASNRLSTPGPAKPPLRTMTPPPPTMESFGGDELAAYRGGAAGMVLDPLAMHGDLTGLTMPVPPVQSATKARMAIAPSPQRAGAQQIRTARAPDGEPVVHVAMAPRPAAQAHISKKLAKNDSTSKHAAKTDRTAAKVADAPPATAVAPATPQVPSDPGRDHAAATPHAKVVMVQGGFGMSYTPLKNVNLTSIVMPARPAADAPHMGSLTVDCVVETSGLPSDCRVVHAERAAAVSTALLAWMGSGLVHRAPTLKDGHPVRARQTWTLAFPAEARRTADSTGQDTP